MTTESNANTTLGQSNKTFVNKTFETLEIISTSSWGMNKSVLVTFTVFTATCASIASVYLHALR